MGGNFQFLKKVNTNLYNIIEEAEKLYRDEYFEQCMTQTRRFGEQICREILNQNNKSSGSFDEMISVLKDNSNGNIEEKEFIDDLYFLKKNGNLSVHSSSVKKDGNTALECLKRAFEIAINYSVYTQGASKNILRLNYNIELLVTGKKSKNSLKDKYKEVKSRQTIPIKAEKTNEINETVNFKHKKATVSMFWKIIFVLTAISCLILLTLTILISIKG